MRRHIKVFVLLLVFVSMIVYWGVRYSSSVETPLKIGSVDLQRAAQESLAGKEAFAKLQKEFDQKKGTIEKKQNEIKKLQEELNQQGLILTEDSKKEKEDAYVKKMKDLQRYVDDSNQDLQLRQRELTQKILVELVKIIFELGDQGQYTMILERQEGVLYASKSIDMTDEVKKRYDQLKAVTR